MIIPIQDSSSPSDLIFYAEGVRIALFPNKLMRYYEYTDDMEEIELISIGDIILNGGVMFPLLYIPQNLIILHHGEEISRIEKEMMV